MNQAKLQDLALLIMRLALGLTVMYYGSQKLFSLFHGPGPTETIGFMHKMFGIPSWLAILAMVAEFFGGLGVALGVLTRLAAFGVACTMFTACYLGTRDPGLQTVLSGANPQDAVKFFYPFVLGVFALCLVMIGGGAFCLDRSLMKGPKRGK